MTYRSSWLGVFPLMCALLFTLPMLLGVVALAHELAGAFDVSLSEFILITIMLSGAYSMLWVGPVERRLSPSLELTAHGIVYRQGWLPWRRIERFIDYTRLYQAVYYRRPGVLSWALDLSTLHIEQHGTGPTRVLELSGFHHADEIVGTINAQIDALSRAGRSF